MILKIILVIVFVKLCLDTLWSRENFMEVPNLARLSEDKEKPSKCNINIQFPNYDPVLNLYNNDNNFLFNNFSNIKKSANPDEC